jgi:methylated-DNA-[protein]-cysteine S-methyltransferase
MFINGKETDRFINDQFENNFSNREKLTKFQWKVLKVTANIPLGETRTYKWVAEKAGSPRAVRAVGQALRRNPFPIIIPCHRVIKQDGSPGGYAGGSGKRKAELLKVEQEIRKSLSNRC